MNGQSIKPRFLAGCQNLNPIDEKSNQWEKQIGIIFVDVLPINMRKTDKKMDNRIRFSLTEVCEVAKDHIKGFKWLTHFVGYPLLPKSLTVLCVFDTNEHLNQARDEKMDDYLRNLIVEKLLEIDIKLQDIQQQIIFDTEENCLDQNNGKWHERLR